MFRDDSFWDQSAWDVQLQYASPAIDAGVPELLDVDGTRSDMGAFGGPAGISYQYVDLPPKAVKLDTIYYISDSAKVKMNWKHNTESDLMGYFIYRDTTENFMPSAENEKCFLTENSYEAIIGDIKSPVLYYKILAIDSAKNKSEIDSVYKIVRGDTVTTFINRVERNYDFQLGQNYPNPFNPETTITYEMKQAGKVSIKVYDIKGEYISTIENAQESKGKHIIKFNGDNLASGIYLYRIEVTGANRTPLYQDMKKMILVK